MRTVIYARISRDRTGGGLGVAAQEADCRALADQLGWQVVDTFADNDLSAYSGKPRPGYRAMLAALEAGEADAVLAWHEDRLHRSPRELEDYIDTCEPRSIPTRFVQAGDLNLTTASGRMTARIRGAVTRGEVEHMIERARRAKRRSAEAGKWKGGRRPFGYEDDGVTIRESEAAHLREAARQVLAGTSLAGIARQWNDAGVRTSTGKQWRPTEVSRTLLRPRNAGLMEHSGEVIGQAEWPSLIESDQWHALVALLTDPSRRMTTGPARKWLGSGLYICAVCEASRDESPYVVTQGRGPQATTARGARIYRCRPGHVSKNQGEVDEQVLGTIAARLRKDDVRTLLAQQQDDDGGEALEVRAVALRGRLDEQVALHAAGAIDGQQLAEGSRLLRADLEAIREQQATVARGTALEGIADAPDPGEAFLSADLDRQRAVIALLARVVIHPAPRGRPSGWRPGMSYYRPEAIKIEWKATNHE